MDEKAQQICPKVIQGIIPIISHILYEQVLLRLNRGATCCVQIHTFYTARLEGIFTQLSSMDLFPQTAPTS